MVNKEHYQSKFQPTSLKTNSVFMLDLLFYENIYLYFLQKACLSLDIIDFCFLECFCLFL